MLKVIYEDNHLLVCEKPVNMPVQADSSGDMDLLTLAKRYIKDKYNKPGEVYLGLVHRLDRPVGGVMVFARTSKAAARLTESFKKHTTVKKYAARDTGKPPDSPRRERSLVRGEENNPRRKKGKPRFCLCYKEKRAFAAGCFAAYGKAPSDKGTAFKRGLSHLRGSAL